MRTVAPSGSTVASSRRQTLSAPSGIGAPVMMRTASPSLTWVVARSPAKIESVMRSRTDPPSVSSALNANPSIEEFANRGDGSLAVTTSAATQPRASSRVSGTAASGERSRSTNCRASEREIIGLVILAEQTSPLFSSVPSIDDGRRLVAPGRATLPKFAFPHRHTYLQRVDAVTRGVKGVVAMRGRHRDYDRCVRKFDAANPVVNGDGFE